MEGLGITRLLAKAVHLLPALLLGNLARSMPDEQEEFHTDAFESGLLVVVHGPDVISTTRLSALSVVIPV
jgi:hypothetical protein